MDVFFKKNKRTIKRVATLLFIAAILFVINKEVARTSKGILEDVARRQTEETIKDLIYIGESDVALAAAPSGSADAAKIAKEAFEEINGIRKSQGLSPLKWSDRLEKVAMLRAKEVTDKFSHKRTDGSDYWSVDPEAVYAENISKGYRQSNTAVSSWMESESHNVNLMDSELSSMAIGIYEGKDGNWYWAVEFGL